MNKILYLRRVHYRCCLRMTGQWL